MSTQATISVIGEFDAATAQTPGSERLAAVSPQLGSDTMLLGRAVQGSTAFRWVVVRSAPTPIVINLPDHAWG
jgi:hypothetical protein